MSHAGAGARVWFDDRVLVARVGLVAVMARAERAGPGGLACLAQATHEARLTAGIEHVYVVSVAGTTETPYTFAKLSCAAALGP